MPTRSESRRRHRASALILAIALPSAAVAAERHFAIDAIAGAAPAAQRQLRVTQGDTVVVRLTSDKAGEAHLHAYRLTARLSPGAPAQWRFVAKASGRFRIEWHAQGWLSRTHGPVLATLDVMPE